MMSRWSSSQLLELQCHALRQLCRLIPHLPYYVLFTSEYGWPSDPTSSLPSSASAANLVDVLVSFMTAVTQRATLSASLRASSVSPTPSSPSATHSSALQQQQQV